MSSPLASRAPTPVRLEAVTKQYGALTAVDGIDLDVPAGELVALLGPSGCGKTTLLRLVGGFEQPDAGRIWIGDRDVTRTPPQARPSAMVFQSYALFPSMTVAENVAYGLQVQRRPKAAVQERVAEALRIVGLADRAGQAVTTLSGGQQQRVALARAIAVEPAVLLFDEPLSNLDQALRESTRRELRHLHERLGTTSLYVTHDQQEALVLADRIAVLDRGRIVEVGTPERLYRTPETAYVAAFLGGSNLVDDAQVLAGWDLPPRPSPDAVLAVRPEHVALFETEGAGERTVPGRVRGRVFLGAVAEIEVEVGTAVLRAWIDPDQRLADPVQVRPTQARWVRGSGTARAGRP